MSSDLMSLTSVITVRVSTPEGPTKLHTAHALRAICATGGSDRIATPELSCLPPRGCFTSWSWQGDLKGCNVTSRTVRGARRIYARTHLGVTEGQWGWRNNG